MAYVDKLKIDNNNYDITDTKGRAETAKKIDIDTTGDLNQTVSGDYNVTASNVNAKVNKLHVEFNDPTSSLDIIKTTKITEPVVIGNTRGGVKLGGTLQINTLLNNFDSNFKKWPIKDYRGNTVNVAILQDGADFSTIPVSPVDIRTYQDLKMDGTDDITATINTHTKNEPLFIPAGTYKISAPLQLKHSLYGAGSSRDPRRGKSDTILKYTANPTAFGSQGVITVSGDDVTGNIVIAHLDIICNGMIGGVVFTTNVYTDNSLYDVSIYGVKSYGVYLQPNNSTLNRYCYVDHVSVWGYSDNTPKERWDGNVGFFVGDKAPDCCLNNVLSMVCQTGFDIRKNTFGVNWITFNGIPANGTGGTDANNWWNNTNGVKITNDDIHVTNLYIDTCRRGIVFDGPGKSAAYIDNLIYACEESTATTGEGNATIALIGTSPSPQLTVNGGVINRTSKVSTTIQTIGTYPVTAMVCKIDNAYIYTKREYIFTGNNQYICAAGEHRCIDLAITNQMQYTVAGQSMTGDPYQYKAFAIIPVDVNTSQGCIHLTDGTNMDYTIYITKDQTSTSLDITAFDNRALSQSIFSASAGTGKTVTWNVIDSEDKLYYSKDSIAINLYCKRHASTEFTVGLSGFQSGISPVILDRIRNEDGTPMDYPRWDNNNGMTAIKVLRPNIS